MSRRMNLLIGAAALTAVAAGGATAFAQAQAQPEPRRVEREVRIERGGDRVVRVERDGDRVVIHRGHGDHAMRGRDRAEHLKNILQLRPNQEAALTAYLAAMQPKARAERLDAKDEAARPKTTTEKLARMEQRLAERDAAQRARIDATRRFYNQLDAGQKKAFDELPLMMGPAMGDMPMRAMRIMHRLPHGEFPGGFRHDMPMPPMPPMPPAPPAPPRL